MRERLEAAFKAFKNPYLSRTEAESDWQSAMAEQVKREARRLAELSAEMVQDQRYGEMRALYQRIVEQSTRLLIWYDVPASVTSNRTDVYVEMMRHLQEQLRVLTQIVNLPKEFAAKAEELKETPSPTNPNKAYAA